jgi:alkylmercury lyase
LLDHEQEGGAIADTENVERLAERLIAAVPTLDAEAQRVGLALIRSLAAGAPVSDHEVAVAAGAAEPGVRDALDRWPGVFRDEDGRVVGFMGLSVVEFGEHRIETDRRRLTAWCAWDTLFLPGLLGRPARVSSRCPVTGEAISLTVSVDGPHGVSPAGTVLSLLTPERPFDANVLRTFCHFVHYFASEQAARDWTAEHPGTFKVSVDDGFRLGQRTNVSAFGAALDGAEIAA